MPSPLRRRDEELPDIDFDPILDLPGTTIYTQDPDELVAVDAEDLARIRAERKARIKAAAHAYLRGNGLFIISAGLQGPFNDGWKNPWSSANKKRKRGVDAEEIRPEAAAETAAERACKLLRTSEADSRVSELNNQTPWKSYTPMPRKAPSSVGIFRTPLSKSAGPPTSEEKVTAWLRRNNEPRLQQHLAEPTSPTPQRRPPKPKPIQPRSPPRNRTPPKQVIAVSSQDVKAPIQLPDRHVAESFDTIVPAGRDGVRPSEAHCRLQDVLQNETMEDEAVELRSPRRLNRSRSIDEDDSARAEAAILRMSRRSPKTANKIRRQDTDELDAPEAQNSSPAGNVSEGTPDRGRLNLTVSESQSPEPEVERKRIEASIDAPLQAGQSTQGEGTRTRGGLRTPSGSNHLTISKSVSVVQSKSLPPSAQLRPEPQTSASYFSSGALLSTVGDIDRVDAHTVEDHQENNPESQVLIPSSQPEGAKDEEAPESRRQNTSPRTEATTIHHCHNVEKIPSSQPENQDIAEHPRGGKDISYNNANTAGAYSAQKPTSPPRRTNKKRKTTFADTLGTMSSAGSIKNALRVQKASTKPPHSPEKRPASPSVSRSEVDRHPNAQVVSSLSVKQPQKSILKISNSTTVATTSKDSVRISPKSSARSRAIDISSQVVGGQNGDMDGANNGFDIEEALNDMSSFLSTWDAEKISLQLH